MIAVAVVANVASEDCFQGMLDDSSTFHHFLLNSASWPLGFCESLYIYHTLSEARVAYIRSKAILALAYLDDSWLGNFQSTHGQPEREQWLAVAEASHVAMLVSFL